MAELRGPRVLIAGMGNVFFSDDAFGVEVVRRLNDRPLPANVCARDVGIRSMHLAYDLAAAPCEMVLLVDVVSRGGAPGTLYVIDPDTDFGAVCANAHGVTPDQLLPLVRALGGDIDRVLLVACEPASLAEGMGLSAPVAAVLDAAVDLVLKLASESVTVDTA
jgi:hydrogenase maturation protease